MKLNQFLIQKIPSLSIKNKLINGHNYCQNSVMKSRFILFLSIPLLILISSCSKEDQDIIPELQLTDNQVKLIDQFKQVTVVQNGFPGKVTHKWNSVMKIFIEGNPTIEHIEKTKQTINIINGLTTDGFNIQLESDINKSNINMFIGSREDYNQKYAQTFPSNSTTTAGHFTQIPKINNILDNGVIWIGTDITNSANQNATIVHELTHAIGFLSHAVGRLSVINFSLRNDRLISDFTETDQELIRLLYHPSITAGLDDNEVDRILTKILLGQ